MRKVGSRARWISLFQRRIKVAVAIVCAFGIVFVFYQMFSVKQLSDETSSLYASRHMRRGDKLDGSVKHIHDKQNLFTHKDHELQANAHKIEAIRGVKKSDLWRYTPNSKGTFVCSYSKQEIDFAKLNDDYCDCADGSDEPSTSACGNGRFYCDIHDSHSRVYVPSGWVNDGICDCCDGSDEWEGVHLKRRLPDDVQKKLRRYQSPCPNVCILKY